MRSSVQVTSATSGRRPNTSSSPMLKVPISYVKQNMQHGTREQIACKTLICDQSCFQGLLSSSKDRILVTQFDLFSVVYEHDCMSLNILKLKTTATFLSQKLDIEVLQINGQFNKDYWLYLVKPCHENFYRGTKDRCLSQQH